MRLDFPPDSPLHLFTEDELAAVFAAGAERRYATDDLVVKEGEPGDSMFFVLDGFVGARLDSGAMVRSYAPGTYFGELSFINPGHRRSTTIIATTPARLLCVDQASVQSLLTTHPRLIFTILRRACAFLVDAERNLISDLRRRNAELQETIKKLEFTRQRLTREEELSRTDQLTGLFNRRAFDLEAPNFVSRALGVPSTLAVLVMDLDEFKPINDTLGHAAGDAVLFAVGRLLQQGVRKTDLPCRFGGDEFVVVLADVDEDSARARAESIRKAIGVMSHPGTERGLRVTATIGGTLYRPGESVDEFLNRADAALNDAKRAGRNRLGWA
ncbi:MAG: diguanylate cyclase domain-containing protein [Myxococcota bacterium]